MRPSVYSPLNSSAFFMIQQRQKLFRKILAKHCSGVDSVRFLEIGCGNGQWLAEFQMFGLRVGNMYGIELDPERANEASGRIAGADIQVGNAAKLPWDDGFFDIVFQSTVFTSILDSSVREKAAEEMKRVCKPNGIVLWYDFIYDSPSNANVRGVAKREIVELFSPWKVNYQKTTLAPPIARRTVPLSWLFSEMLEAFCPFLRTHAVAVITKS